MSIEQIKKAIDELSLDEQFEQTHAILIEQYNDLQFSEYTECEARGLVFDNDALDTGEVTDAETGSEIRDIQLAMIELFSI